MLKISKYKFVHTLRKYKDEYLNQRHLINNINNINKFPIDKHTRVIFQGLTGRQGTIHSSSCIDYGTLIVGGVNPLKGGSYHTINTNKGLCEIPIYSTVSEAVSETKATASIIMVPAISVYSALMDAIEAKIPLVVCVTDSVPLHDMMKIQKVLSESNTCLIGPNSPGVIVPGACKIGIMPDDIAKEGSIGIMGRSGTLLYEAVSQLTAAGVGQKICVGLGGDPIIGTTMTECLCRFLADPDIKAILIMGEIGGVAEQQVASFLIENKRLFPNSDIPIVAYVAGISAPNKTRMGHAGAIINGKYGLAKNKIDAFIDAGVHVVRNPSMIGVTMAKLVS